MTAWLTGIAASVIEWALTKLFALIGQDISTYEAKVSTDEALANNQTNLQTAINSGDPNAIAKAGENSLNNVAP